MDGRWRRGEGREMGRNWFMGWRWQMSEVHSGNEMCEKRHNYTLHMHNSFSHAIIQAASLSLLGHTHLLVTMKADTGSAVRGKCVM